MNLDEYDRRWENMVAQGKSVHGELDFVERLRPVTPLSILDAGCGTGRLAIEAERRGHRVVGVDLDPDMLERARSKAPAIEWICADLSRLALEDRFDVVVMAGNIPLFCVPGTQPQIITALARHLVSGGVLICGFSIEDSVDSYTPARFECDARAAGLDFVSCSSNWNGDPVGPAGTDDYAVIVCEKPLPTG